MGSYNVHAGHCPQGKGASGAVGLLQESVEDRKVKDRVISDLKNAGHTVYDCTCEDKTTKNGCLKKIVSKCNAHSVDLDVSIHLNSSRNDYGGDGETGGVEVWCYNSKTSAIAAQICANISNALGIKNRGVKYKQSLYVLKHTKSPALLVECCFVDDKDDVDRWNADKCGDAIASAIAGKTVQGSVSSGSTVPSNPSAPASSGQLKVDGYWGTKLTRRLQQIFGTQVDGVVSNQFSCYRAQNPGLDKGWEWESKPSGYSPIIKAIQSHVGVKQDGHIGPNTIRAIQRWMGCVPDGYFSRKSPCIKKLQEWCNRQ